MRQPVEQGSGHLRITEHRGPFREAQIGGNDEAGPLVELADEMEQQGATGLTERQV